MSAASLELEPVERGEVEPEEASPGGSRRARRREKALKRRARTWLEERKGFRKFLKDIKYIIVYDVPAYSPKRRNMYRKLQALPHTPAYLTKSVMATGDEDSALSAGEIVAGAGGAYIVFHVKRVVKTNL